MSLDYAKTSLKKRSASRSFEQYFTNKRINEPTEDIINCHSYSQGPSLRTPQSSHHSHEKHFADMMDCAESNLPPSAISPHCSFSPIPPVSPYSTFSLHKSPDRQGKVANIKVKVPATLPHTLFDTLMTHSRDTARQHRDTKSSMLICWQCQAALQSATKCAICMRTCCQSRCMRSCERCAAVVCSLCSEVDYSLQFDRLLCVTCVQSCNEHSAMDV
ncbi:hypothetical protein EON64_01620 [archaeon]|nr:MAG: hypothetical protein EON64_01620 [archaeon]